MDLTAFLVAVLVAMAHGLTLQEEIRLAPGYSDLTDCQQYCIAGRLSWDIVTDVASWATLSTCSTKTCICAPERRTAAETLIGACQKGFICAGSTVEQNGAAVRWVAGYCDWGTVMTPTLPVSSTIVTSPIASFPSSARSSSTADNPASTTVTASVSPTTSPTSSSARSSGTPGNPTQTSSTPTGTNNHANIWGPIVAVILGAVAAAIIKKYVAEKRTAVQTTN